jgi:alanyl-tRNA synthetase
MGARLHGMEKVVGSIPTRSTNKICSSGGSHVTAGRSNEVIYEITSELENFGLKPEFNTNVISSHDDTTTLFTIAGMQPLKPRFAEPDGSQSASFQSCIRMNDLDEVGDGSHLTSFTMVGSFGFGSNNYDQHCELWDRIITRLGIAVDTLTFHPDSKHESLWRTMGYKTKPDTECIWRANDAEQGSHCCEMFVGDLEIGNLVNPGGHSIDVGFGLERLVQVVEGVSSVDGSSMFDQRLPRISRDHCRTLELLHANGVRPGNKGRPYVYRRLLRRLIREIGSCFPFTFSETLQTEIESLNHRMKGARKAWKNQQHRDAAFWWDTHGILPEEMHLISS